jgi:hypothetical protein
VGVGVSAQFGVGVYIQSHIRQSPSTPITTAE